jgi:hypothetical protein
MVDILALICLISFWFMEISYERELMYFSSSWLQVWVMVKGKSRNGVVWPAQKRGYL